MRTLIASLLLACCASVSAQGTFFAQNVTTGNPASGTPTFSPGSGIMGPQSVTISATGGSVICYNTTGSPATNGTTGCTTGTLYSGAVSVSTSETLYAVSGGTGYTDSSVGSAAYTISGHAMKVIQTTTCTTNGGGSSTMTCTLTATQTGNSLLIGCRSGDGTVLTFVPSATPITATASTINNAFIVSNVTTGTTAVVVTNTSIYDHTACLVAEVSGVITVSPIDVNTVFVRTGYLTSGTTGSVTTTNANDVIIGIAYSDSDANGPYTPGSGYATIGTATNVNTIYGDIYLEYKNVSATGTQNPPVSWTTTGYVWGATAALELQ